MHKVVVVGAAVVDTLVRSKSLKVVKGHNLPGGVAMCEMLGGKIEAEDGIIESGGGGTNVSVGLRRLGQSVKIITRIANDEAGQIVRRSLEQNQVDLSMMQEGEGKTGLSTVLVASDGSRSIVTYRGESSVIESGEVDWDEVRKADWLQVSSLGGEIGFLEDLLNFALEKGIKIGVNPGKGEIKERDRLMKMMPKFDFFNVNRMEASMLMGIEFENERLIVKGLADMGLKLAAVTDGKRGASLLRNRRWIKMDAFPYKSIDDTGAGDAFVSGAVAGIVDNRSMEMVLKMGLANGGSVVKQLGAKAGLLNCEEMERLIEKKLMMVEEWI